MASPDRKRHELVLRVWEATNSERELQGVLAAVSDLMQPLVSFASIAVVSFQGEKHELYAMHIVGVPHHEGQTMEEIQQKAQRVGFKVRPVPPRPLEPYAGGE